MTGTFRTLSVQHSTFFPAYLEGYFLFTRVLTLGHFRLIRKSSHWNVPSRVPNPSPVEESTNFRRTRLRPDLEDPRRQTAQRACWITQNMNNPVWSAKPVKVCLYFRLS